MKIYSPLFQLPHGLVVNLREVVTVLMVNNLDRVLVQVTLRGQEKPRELILAMDENLSLRNAAAAEEMERLMHAWQESLR